MPSQLLITIKHELALLMQLTILMPINFIFKMQSLGPRSKFSLYINRTKAYFRIRGELQYLLL